MATHQDIVDYYEIDRVNGDSNTRSLAALALYRFVRNLLRHMQWPDGEFQFGRFVGGNDSRVDVKFNVGKRSFSASFAIESSRPTDVGSTGTELAGTSWQITIEQKPSLLYEPGKPWLADTLYEPASAEILRKALSALPIL